MHLSDTYILVNNDDGNCHFHFSVRAKVELGMVNGGRKDIVHRYWDYIEKRDDQRAKELDLKIKTKQNFVSPFLNVTLITLTKLVYFKNKNVRKKVKLPQIHATEIEP